MRRGPGRETSNCLLAPGEGWEGNQPTSWRSIWHSRMGSRWQARHTRREWRHLDGGCCLARHWFLCLRRDRVWGDLGGPGAWAIDPTESGSAVRTHGNAHYHHPQLCGTGGLPSSPKTYNRYKKNNSDRKRYVQSSHTCTRLCTHTPQHTRARAQTTAHTQTSPSRG